MPSGNKGLPKKDITGQRFGRLVAISCGERVRGRFAWKCQCDCGNTTNVVTAELINGNTKSCGCYATDCKSQRKRTHGRSHSRLYNVYDDIKARCYRPNTNHYHLYGGRGITMCSEWLDDFQSFYDWSMANGYDPNAKRGECTIDRIDNNKGYSPDNCRWVSGKVQSRNRRTNHYITFNGETKCIREWAEIYGIDNSKLFYRLKHGYPFEEAIKNVDFSRKESRTWQIS